jgi:hypothetical protein
MKKMSNRLTGFIGAVLLVVAGLALAAQDKNSLDKYSLKVPGGLAFAEFRGYESWQVISISRNPKVMAATVGNPAMIEAYRAGDSRQR